MNVQAFIANWDSPRCKAEELHKCLSETCPTQILSSYDVSFREQWSEAISKFDGDVMIWAMADCLPQTWNLAYQNMLSLISRGDIGVWAPNLSEPSQLTSEFQQVEPGVYDVPNTNLIFVALTKRMLGSMPPITMHRNGWMYDYFMTAVARSHGLKTVCDSRFIALHKSGSVYDMKAAEKEKTEWMNSLPDKWRVAIEKLVEEAR